MLCAVDPRIAGCPPSGPHLGVDIHLHVTAVYTVMSDPLHEEVLMTVLTIPKHSYKTTRLLNTFQ